jgi:hypothetical protein
MRGRDVAQRGRCHAGPLSQGGIEGACLLQTGQAFCDQRRLLRKHRGVELKIDPDAAGFARGRYAAPGFARDESASAYLADDKAAAQQLGIYAARRRNRDLAFVGKAALRRQARA